MDYDAIIVGGGIAGLTAAAYLSRAGISTLLCEKEGTCGGLVNSFTRDGFVFDGGIRAIENSGVVLPMLRQLGLEVDFIRNHISIGIEDQVIHINTEENLNDYQMLLSRLYPECRDEIAEITLQIRKIMQYMKVQYGIDNPLFLDLKKDRQYMLRVILPWMVKYALTTPKISALNKPVREFLQSYTRNQSLLDIITQHFFNKTPAFFALSYIKLYLDYRYPRGGTEKFVEKLIGFFEDHGGQINVNTHIMEIDPQERRVADDQGNEYRYQRLIWSADLKSLYEGVNMANINEEPIKQAITTRQSEIIDKKGNDSIFTVYLEVDLDKNYFSGKASEHFFYTPSRVGQSKAGQIPQQGEREEIEKWVEAYLKLTTYEISIPVLRDDSLAPEGKTGLIVSVLFDYQLSRHIEAMGWYKDFKIFCETCMVNTLDESIYPGIKNTILNKFSATPLSIARITGNADGAITGWSFSNQPMPAENRLPNIMNAIKTPIPGIYQAGQWTYSPAGLPISILTGKLAADRVIKELSKRSGRMMAG
jgi:phytoene dehydrogenase-like protein